MPEDVLSVIGAKRLHQTHGGARNRMYYGLLRALAAVPMASKECLKYPFVYSIVRLHNVYLHHSVGYVSG